MKFKNPVHQKMQIKKRHQHIYFSPYFKVAESFTVSRFFALFVKSFF